MLVGPTLLNIHYKSLGNINIDPILEEPVDDLKPMNDLPRHIRGARPRTPTTPRKAAAGRLRAATLARFIQSAATRKVGHSLEKLQTFADGSPTWSELITQDKKEYHYVQAVFFKPTCLMDCHGKDDGSGAAALDHIDNHLHRRAADGQHWVNTEPGDLAGAVVVSLPMEPTTRAINSNRAALITFALSTAVLAMISSYLAIHFVVVRPAERMRRLRRDPDTTG